MSTFLLLLFLASFLLLANAASYTLTGELQAWASGDPGFGTGFGANGAFPASLNLYGKPTGTGNAPGFDNWWSQPIGNQAKLTPFSLVMDESGTTYTFSRSAFVPITGVSLYSFHVRGEINCAASACTPLTLQSSDDAAIYIDGALKCSVVGSGTSTNTGSCTTSVGGMATGQYTRYVDIFYARRATSSNGVLIFTLPTAGATCSIFSRSVLTRNIYPFGDATSQPSAGPVFFGTPSDPQPVLQLIKSTDQSSTTAVYSKTPVRYQNGFSTYFKFNMTGANSQGFAFVLQSKATNGPTSGVGPGLGYSIGQSLAIEFDVAQNVPPAVPLSTCDGAVPHVEVHAVLSGDNTPCKVAGTSAFTSSNMNAAIPNFNNGSTYEVYIEYLPGQGGADGSISVWATTVASGLNALQYQASRWTGSTNWLAKSTITNANMKSIFANAVVVSAGFSSSTVSAVGTNIFIWDWKYNSVPVGSFLTTVNPSSGTPQVARNFQGSKSFTITLMDACGGAIPIGTDVVNVTLQSNPGGTMGSTMVSDLGTGQYDIWWWHTLAANYNLNVMVYGQPILPGVTPTWVPSPFPVVIVPDIISAPNCYFTPATIGTPNYLASDLRNVTISARDQFNNSVTTPSTSFSVQFLTFPASPLIAPVSQSGADYLFTIGTHVAAVNSRIFLRYGASDVAGSPTAPLNITAGLPPDAQQTAITLIGAGLQGSIAGVPAKIQFQVKDSWQNTHDTVVPFTATAALACAPPVTDARCSQPTPVSITIDEHKDGDPTDLSWFTITWTTPIVSCFTVNITIDPAVNNNRQLPNLPNVCVLPNSVNVTTSIVTKETEYTAGSPATFTIQAKDTYNNSRVSDNSPDPHFTVTVGGATTTCVTGSPASNAAVEGVSCNYAGVGGIYQVSFKPLLATSQTVVVALGANTQTSSINVVPGPGYPPNDNVGGIPNQFVAGEKTRLTVDSYDEYMNLRFAGNDTDSFVVALLPTTGFTAVTTIPPLIPNGDGHYFIDITPFTKGDYSLSVKLLSQNVNNSNPGIPATVRPSITNLSVSLPSGAGLGGAIGDTTSAFNITAYDRYDNINDFWKDTMTCTVCYPDQTSNCGTLACTVTPSGTTTAPGGIFTITYTTPTYDPLNNNFYVKLMDQANGTATQTRVFALTSSDSGTFQYAVLKASVTTVCNSASAAPYNILNNTLVAGTPFYYYLYNYLVANCSIPKNAGQNEPAYKIDFNAVVGTAKFSGSVTNDSSRTTATSAIYNVSVVGTKVGDYRITIRAGGLETPQSTAGVYATVVPGPLDPPSCIVQQIVGTDRPVAGTAVSFNITLRDAYQNLLASSTGITLEVNVSDPTGSNVTSKLLGYSLTAPSTAPYMTLTFAPTVAGVNRLSIYGPTPSGGKQLLALKTITLTVQPDVVNATYTCFWTPYSTGTNSCPTLAATQPATAGQEFPVTLFARDRFNNQVVDPALNFTLDIGGQTIKTVTSGYTGSLGRYALSFQANKTVNNGTLTAKASNPAGVQVANTLVTVQPAALSEEYSHVDGLLPMYIAGDWVNWTLVAKDLYDNVWYATASAALQIDVALDGPEQASKAILSVPTTGYIASAATNPGALYNYQYIPTTASTNNLPTIDGYQLTFKYNNVELNLTGNTPFLVYPAVPAANQTIIPTIPSQIKAGDQYNFTIQLRDRYANKILNGSAPGFVDAKFYDGPGTQCNQQSINTSKVVNQFTNRRYLNLDDDKDVTDNNDGTYKITIWTAVAGPYFAGITVGNADTTPCRQISTVFTIIPVNISGLHSNISGSGLDPMNDVVAGTPLQLTVVLRDMYDNIVSSGQSPTWSVGPTPMDRPTLCPTDKPLLADGTANNVSIFSYEDHKNGTWSVSFTPFKANAYHLALLVSTGSVNQEAIGAVCHNITVIPWYVYKWISPPPPSPEEALTTSLRIFGQDQFDNNVTKGEHYWKIVYRRQTSDILAPYGFARSTPKEDPYVVYYNAEHDGNYTAFVTLVQDPQYSDRQKYPVLTDEAATQIYIAPATCERATGSALTPYRCPTADFSSLGTCVNQAAWTTGCPATSTSDATCGSGSKCDAGQCASSCATGVPSEDMPTWASVCPAFDTEFRMTPSSDCPSARVCPPNWFKCADGRTCVQDTSKCPTPAACSAFLCANGACVTGIYDCPTDVTCSNGGVVCEDGTCRPDHTTCPSLFLCAPPNTLKCSDGSCRTNSQDCPSGVVCPRGYVLCESGHCKEDVSDCPDTTCSTKQVHCPDGTCRDNYALCPSGITCPRSRPVLCPDRSCVATSALCREVKMCSNATFPYLCPGGTCANTQEECPTFPTCPLDTPVLCEDQTCANTLDDCDPTGGSARASRCPAHRPFNCPDGGCANSLATCPTLGVCTPDTPVRCTTASCAVAGNVCPLASQLDCPGVLCPGGGCAAALSQCPTPITCPTGYERCSDGACRTNCTGIQRDSRTYCDYPQYDCPGHEAGFSCVENPQECPQSITCPFDRPIRCIDRSCAASEALCKPAAYISPTYSTCPANTFTATGGLGCGSDVGTRSTTCPFGMAKCWDETCRHIAEDCPAEPLCTVNHPNPRFVSPYLCPNGDCARNLYRCAALAYCPKGQIRCPASDTNAVIKCATTLSECPDLTMATSPLTCPFGFERCKDGACKNTCQKPTCPRYLPFLCDDGKCVQRPNQCANKPCLTDNTKTQCWDKTCPTDTETCIDTKQTDPVASLNVCPLSMPFKCTNGFCAISSATCPGLPQPRGKCSSATPILCADGSCQMSSIQCPVIKPCWGTQVRCNNGVCALNMTQCPSTSLCSGSDVMCPNGLCATSNSTCYNPMTGCFGNDTKCDDGTCGTTCPTTYTPGHGCLNAGESRCFDGSCSATCSPLPRSCYPGDPAGTPCEWPACAAGQMRCANGKCATPAGAATTCKTAWGCDIAKPFRGVDGVCRSYPADGRATQLTGGTKDIVLSQGTVVCSTLRSFLCKDGSCAADPSHCPAFQSHANLCKDNTYVSGSGSCPSVVLCPPGSPTLCLDGSCRRSARECGALIQAPQCASPMYQCFDGYCASSSLECVQRQYAFHGKSAQFANNSDHGTGACDSGEFLCWNGACLLRSNSPDKSATAPSNADSMLACPPLPGCPADAPLRCWDGSCINGTCPSGGGSCPSKTERCEDGTCRATGTCPQYAGCPVEAPYYCPYAAQQCLTTAAACAAYDPQDPEVCAQNCVRDGMARAQQVTVSSLYPTVIDVVVDQDYAPITQIMFPPGAVYDQVATLVINPATFQDLQNGRARINSVLVDRTPAEILLSPPFYLSWQSAGARQAFNLNVTVQSNIDTTLFAGSAATGSVVTTNPCQLIGIWSAQGRVSGTGCIYNVTVTNTTMQLTPDEVNLNVGCPRYGYLTSTVYKVNTTTDIIADTQHICVCSNVTKSNGTGANAVTFQPGDLICALWILVGTEEGVNVGVTFQADPTMQDVCPTEQQSGAYISDPPMTSYGEADETCAGASGGLIPPNDICLCFFNPFGGYREWQCTYTAYSDRIALPPWEPTSGRANYVVQGLMPSNYMGMPMGICYIPLPAPPAPVKSEESWWQKYGKIVLGVGISMFVLLLILACAISRLIRYRKKYHEERAEAEELREQAQELDEKHGGLGVYDDEVEMIANPLVVEMQELQKQLEQTNAHLKTQEEMDEHQMAALDKERQRILEEIKRVKDAIAAQAKTAPTRVDEIPASGAVAVSVGSGTGTTSTGTGAERQEFNQGPTARRKKQDL